MTTIALDHVVTDRGIDVKTDVETDVQLDRAAAEAGLPTSVANPRRTTWTGYAKNATDRLPSV